MNQSLKQTKTPFPRSLHRKQQWLSSRFECDGGCKKGREESSERWRSRECSRILLGDLLLRKRRLSEDLELREGASPVALGRKASAGKKEGDPRGVIGGSKNRNLFLKSVDTKSRKMRQ